MTLRRLTGSPWEYRTASCPLLPSPLVAVAPTVSLTVRCVNARYSNGTPELMGIFAGHCYFFMKTKYPRDFGGPDLLATPQFLRNLFPEDERERERSFGVPPSARAAAAGGGAPRRRGWGQGQQLGN
jgi:hypothetical protein